MHKINTTHKVIVTESIEIKAKYGCFLKNIVPVLIVEKKQLLWLEKDSVCLFNLSILIHDKIFNFL